jgi:hypothetical protein
MNKDKQIITRFAKRIVGHGFSVPVIFFLEMSKYASFIGSQLLVFFGPLITSFIRSDGYYDLARLLEDKENVEFLLTEIERLESEKKQFKALGKQ